MVTVFLVASETDYFFFYFQNWSRTVTNLLTVTVSDSGNTFVFLVVTVFSVVSETDPS